MDGKHRTAITLPNTVAFMLKDVSKATGKPVNSVIVDSCIEYLKKFRDDYPFLFEEERNERQKYDR